MIIAVAVLFVSVLALAIVARRRQTRRIVNLDWPERFKNWQTMSGYCKRFLRHNGWNVRACSSADADMLVSKRPHHLVVNLLIEKDHYPTIPEHFLNRSTLAQARRKRPVAVVTDFNLPDDVTERCRRRQIYPIYYKDLASLDKLVPPLAKFHKI